MRKIPYILVLVLFAGTLLPSCNLPFLIDDTASVQTAAALTVQAQLTPLTPPTSTFTPAPFPTLPPAVTNTPANTLLPPATSTSNCDRAEFVADVTVPDNTEVDASDGFTKTWRLKNSGTCSWTTSYALVFISGASMGGPSVQALVGNVNPGQTVDLSVNLTAPAADGTYTGNWGLRNGSGVIFLHFYVQIVVDSGSGFAVIHVTYTYSAWSDASHTNCPRVTAQITTNGAGDVSYHWVFSDGATTSPDTLSFDSADTKSIHYDWALGSSHAGDSNFMGINIDEPNHQGFGHQSFTTACTSP